MDKKVFSERSGEVSYSLVEVVDVFREFFIGFSDMMGLFSEPRILLQTVGSPPEQVDNKEFKECLIRLRNVKINMFNVLNTFKRDVFTGHKKVAVPQKFGDNLYKWISRAKEDLESVLNRPPYPEEMVLVNAARELYFEAMALVKEFNSLISMYNSKSGYKIPLIITSGLDVFQKDVDGLLKLMRY